MGQNKQKNKHKSPHPNHRRFPPPQVANHAAFKFTGGAQHFQRFPNSQIRSNTAGKHFQRRVFGLVVRRNHACIVKQNKWSDQWLSKVVKGCQRYQRYQRLSQSSVNNTVATIQWQQHSGNNTVATTQWQQHSGNNTVATMYYQLA